jgi:hypothetical protein
MDQQSAPWIQQRRGQSLQFSCIGEGVFSYSNREGESNPANWDDHSREMG